ncbi:hypothetical protein BMS_3259 [Halobacteriovorax marinus SJ]|uniref:Uncharacterized protein n=1 Tax=Halobacteriovorax marinus (strain ATCC BAA-682 / DSM 15412 / SJ) TaxID=862908 RepID=E1X0I2_HALMS|nr:hypothetical protein BMS_3259 [Halobacteriovorax marinus SJ]
MALFSHNFRYLDLHFPSFLVKVSTYVKIRAYDK